MRTVVLRLAKCLLFSSVAVVLAISSAAQQDTSPVQGNAGQASQPGGVTGGPGNPAASTNPTPSTPPNTSTAVAPNQSGKAAANPASSGSNGSSANSTADDNPYNPYLEPPPLPKGKATLIGGIATSVDKVRNRITIQPFGKGTKVKIVLDERSHIYRNGTETTILGVHKGDRVYADTMLDGSKILARNLRVETESTPAEVRGQVIAANQKAGTISVKDELSAKPVTFAVSRETKYSSFRGDVTANDVQPGSLIDVQFSPDRSNRDVAQEVTVLAKIGESYVFAGTVTSLDMRSGTLALDNRSDDQNYEIHFDPAGVANSHDLKVGSEVTARAVFDGKVYKTSNLGVEAESPKEKDKEKDQDQSKLE